jgi:hypothetical protein
MSRVQKQSSEPRAPDAEPQRRARAISVAADAALVGNAAFMRAGFSDPTLVLRWREIAGADVARIAQPLRIRQGSSGAVLTLRADPAAAVFLQHESRALCARINTYLGRQTVERLRFVPGDVAAAPERRTQKNPQESLSDDPARKFAGDDRLKDALLALARARKHT